MFIQHNEYNYHIKPEYKTGFFILEVLHGASRSLLKLTCDLFVKQNHLFMLNVLIKCDYVDKPSPSTNKVLNA